MTRDSGKGNLKIKVKKPTLTQIERVVRNVAEELCLPEEIVPVLQFAVQDAFDVWMEEIPYRKRVRK